MSESDQEQNTRTSQDLKNLDNQTLARKYREQGSKDAFNELLNRAEPAIREGIQNWGGGNTSLNLRAKMVAAEALKKYDPEQAQKVTPRTWVSNNMPKLSKYRDERTSTLHIPDSVKRDVRYLTKLKNQMKEEEGVEPSLGRLKDRAGMSQKRFEKARKAFSESGEPRTEKGDILGGVNSDDRFRAWVDAVYTELDEPGRKIFEGTSGYLGSPIKQKQQLAQELNMSPAAVTSRLNTIHKRLQEFHDE